MWLNNIFGSFQELYTANAAFHPNMEKPEKMPPPNRKLEWDFVMPESDSNPELDALVAEREQNIAEYKEYPAYRMDFNGGVSTIIFTPHLLHPPPRRPALYTILLPSTIRLSSVVHLGSSPSPAFPFPFTQPRSFCNSSVCRRKGVQTIPTR